MGLYQCFLRAFEMSSKLSVSRGSRPRNHHDALKILIGFGGGFALGQLYYNYLLKKIPFPESAGTAIMLIISLILGIGNVVCTQLRCISLLTLPMYCGKPGRAVLKVVVLTYVIAGPIANLGLNAKEVVRVFACSTQLSHNLSEERHNAMDTPFNRALFSAGEEIRQIKDTMRSLRDVITPIELEIEESKTNGTEVYVKRASRKLRNGIKNNKERIIYYQKQYINKLEDRCKKQIWKALTMCIDIFASAYEKCLDCVPKNTSWVICNPLKVNHICSSDKLLGGLNVCDNIKQVNPGLGEGYVTLQKAKTALTNINSAALQYKINIARQLYDFQDAKETGDRVLHAFEEKYIIMHCVATMVNMFVAVLFLRVFTAAVAYHDGYLTDIDYDNVYITGRFKSIDRKRSRRNQLTLLPLKKMERSKYVDIHSVAYMWIDRNKLLTHMLKLMLEVVTATTFVMLDRLFYEALDVVRQHAEMASPKESTRDLEVDVEGTGAIANMVRKIIQNLRGRDEVMPAASNEHCLPRPRLIPYYHYFKIYGGYLWILFLLCINPYTVRLKRCVCSCFYPYREKQRTLHLYNDILKKRMKMQKTLRKKAIQAVRAHYLSGENLRSLRMRFPRLLRWLRVLPAARMTCLICGETEPRHDNQTQDSDKIWHSCTVSKCPFMYCVECWKDVGARCLACDPSLADLSDIDSLSDDDVKKY